MIDEIRLVEKSKWFVGDAEEEPYCMGWNECNEHWMKAVDEMLKVGEWIPCSERLPEESGKYLGQVSWGNITDITFSKKYQKWNAHDSAPPKHAMEVIAWMPLPEPYKEGGLDG